MTDLADTWSIDRFIGEDTLAVLEQLSDNHEAQREYFTGVEVHEKVRWRRRRASSEYTVGCISWLTYLIESGELPSDVSAIQYFCNVYGIYMYGGADWTERKLFKALDAYQMLPYWQGFRGYTSIPHRLFSAYRNKYGTSGLWV